MNIIDTSLIVDPNTQQPFLGTSLSFLQAATKEQINALCLSIINSNAYVMINGYSTSTVYVLQGCVRSGVADGASGTVNITAGTVFYNGEIYTVPALTAGAMSSGKSVYSALSTSNAAFDPVTFSDNTTHSVHNIRQWAFSIATSGSNLQTSFFYVYNTGLPFVLNTTANSPYLTANISGKAYLDPNGNVAINGYVLVPSSPGTSYFCTLPATMYPQREVHLLCNGYGTTDLYLLKITPTGYMSVTTLTGTAPTVGDYIYFCLSYNILG